MGKSLDGDSASPYPRYDIKDICWLSIIDRRSTLHNRKGQPVAKCDIASEMSIQKKEDYDTEEKRKKSQTKKHHNFKTYRQIEVIADMEDLKKLVSEYGKIGSNLNQIAKYFNTGGSRSLAVENEIHQCIADLFQLRKEVLKLAGGKNGNRKTH